ncbi:hypothetical protein BURMUCGD1_3887 [Burkholderia multivorans CGD1]|nr:hypothetical protein BURMUCGD1_3887 [Burkholderia multivorans CGD1]
MTAAPFMIGAGRSRRSGAPMPAAQPARERRIERRADVFPH